MGKLLTLSPEDFLILLLSLLIVFGPAALRLLAALVAFRTSERLRSAARILDRLIREAEQRRAPHIWRRRGMRSWTRKGKNGSPADEPEREAIAKRGRRTA